MRSGPPLAFGQGFGVIVTGLYGRMVLATFEVGDQHRLGIGLAHVHLDITLTRRVQQRSVPGG